MRLRGREGVAGWWSFGTEHSVSPCRVVEVEGKTLARRGSTIFNGTPHRSYQVVRVRVPQPDHGTDSVDRPRWRHIYGTRARS